MRILLSIVLMFAMLSAASPASVPAPHGRKADSVYVCISARSGRYHSYICSGLAHCTHEIKRVTRAQAVKWGYTPCKICYGK